MQRSIRIPDRAGGVPLCETSPIVRISSIDLRHHKTALVSPPVSSAMIFECSVGGLLRRPAPRGASLTSGGARRLSSGPRVAMLGLGLALATPSVAPAAVSGWLSWRGPDQTGVSRETGLPEHVVLQGSNHLWTADFPGKSTPVIANGRLYILGYLGEGPDLQEGLACFDAETGEKLWQQLFNDYLSDTIYLRYATASPTIDPETGNIYIQGTQGLLACFTPYGQRLWKQDMMEMFGRLTFPNSRTATPVIDGELVITRGITANWGAQGAGGDRFYAFDKRTGVLVWSSSPADRPKDNSFSHPYLGWLEGKRVFYAATGDGSVVCVNARTGDAIWRMPLFKAGINATVLLHNNERLVAVFGTPYELGQMVGLKLPKVFPTNAAEGPIVLQRSDLELWANEISSSTSSPILVGDRAYIVAEKGDLCSVDVMTGKILWKVKLGIEQRNSCPLFADGRLYVPMLEDPAGKGGGATDAGTKGAFYIVKPTDGGGQIVTHLELEGRCFGSPAACNGKVYVQTSSKLYCFGRKGNNPGLPPAAQPEAWPAPGPAAQLQIIPTETLLHPGESTPLRVRSLDAKGFVVSENIDPKQVKWDSYIPPTARVRAKLQGAVKEGVLVADANPTPSAGAFLGEYQGLKGTFRARVLPSLPIKEDFESFRLDQTTTNAFEPPTPFAYPPLPWIGARVKFEVREVQGTKALTKTIDNKFFQRAFVFIGDSEMKSYTIRADVMSDGNRRKMSDGGVINQRYLVILKGNEQKLEISSNQELFKSAVPFKWSPNTWYQVKARVDVAADGSGVIRARAWKRGEPEPETWLLETPHKHANQTGSPGLYGFSPQEMRVYLDNITVTPNS
jgi:outer membrane protein assembly factor BamB